MNISGTRTARGSDGDWGKPLGFHSAAFTLPRFWKTFLSMAIIVAAASVANSQTLCVATYNLNYGNQRGDLVLDAVSSAKADLVCFQETTEQSERFLKEQIAQSHPYFYSVGHKGRYFAERFAFASRSELSNLRFVPPGSGLFGFYMATLEFNGESIQIVNVHLTPVSLNRGSGIFDAISALSKTEKIHDEEIKAIVNSVDSHQPLIIVGDFNSVSTSFAPQYLGGMGMVDAFASVTEAPDTHSTWHWPTRPLPLSLRIDYIFHSKHFRTSKSENVRRAGSDHSLVYAVMTRVEDK